VQGWVVYGDDNGRAETSRRRIIT